MPSKKQIVGFLHQLAEAMEIPPRQLAEAALEYANGMSGDADEPGNAGAMEDEALDIEGTAVDTDLSATPPVKPYTGPSHLCLDFGTAISKAFAWDKSSDDPMPLRVGHAAGDPASSLYVLSSTIFISHDERFFFGQEAVNRAAKLPTVGAEARTHRGSRREPHAVRRQAPHLRRLRVRRLQDPHGGPGAAGFEAAASRGTVDAASSGGELRSSAAAARRALPAMTVPRT